MLILNFESHPGNSQGSLLYLHQELLLAASGTTSNAWDQTWVSPCKPSILSVALSLQPLFIFLNFVVKSLIVRSI